MSRVARVWLSFRSIVAVADNDHVITDVNKHLTYHFGWTPADLVGKNIAFILEHYPAEITDTTAVGVYRGRHKNDYFFTVLVQVMRDPMATIVGWVITPVTMPPLFDFSFTPTTAAALSRKLTLDDVDVKGKRVLIRVDFNVPIDASNGRINRHLLAEAKKKEVRVILPIDHLCAADLKSTDPPVVTETADVPKGLMALDVGPRTLALCEAVIREARTVIWNGPVGVFENERFSGGCKRIAMAITGNKDCYSLVGGGDTAAAVKDVAHLFSHVSTGGGATLELLEGKPLPGLVCLTSRVERGSKL